MDFYCSRYERSITPTGFNLPTQLFDVLQERNQKEPETPDILVALGSQDEDFRRIYLCDKLTDVPSIAKEEDVGYLDYCIAEKVKLKFSNRIMEFLNNPQQVMIIGVFDHIELWRPDDFRRYDQSIDPKKLYEWLDQVSL